MTVLLLYATAEGQTGKIMRRIADQLDRQRISWRMEDLSRLPEDLDLDDYGYVVLGASIRYGKHQILFRKFVEQNWQQLNERWSAFISVSLTARKPNRNTPENNPYVTRFLRGTRWAPQQVNVFPGALLYSRYNFFNRTMIQLIMKMGGGSTDLHKDIEYTNWAEVDRYGLKLGATINGGQA